LAVVLDQLGLEGPEAHGLAVELGRFADLRKLRPMDQYVAHLDADRNLEGFELLLAGRGRARAWKEATAWSAIWEPFERSVRIETIDGRLNGFLESSIERAGGDQNLAMLLADVFQWDLDFHRDLREGDRFKVLHETIYLDGRYDSLGEIVAVTYENQGRLLEAYRFGPQSGYYDAEGRPLRKMFLRSPLRYSRITSRFSGRRFHPILKRYRPHHGVDYGAPVGTPVRCTANGSVTFAGWDGGGGKTVKVRHPNGYRTAYLHLSRFAKGIRPGRRVSQGEVVGYVGSTGLATASHLDYRVQQHGRWINPLSLKSILADPVPVQQLPEFIVWRDKARRALDNGEPYAPPSPEQATQWAAAARSQDSHLGTVSR
jgi:murein DD-endopeptidase MepM/ murein hydrolase activator NlpD